MKAAKIEGLSAVAGHLVVRPGGVLCARCMTVDPVVVGDGTPLPAFVIGLLGCAERHKECGK